MNRKRAISIAVAVIIVVIIITGLVISISPGASVGAPEHITIARAREQPGQTVKVGGDVVPGSITWDDASRSLRFTLTGEGDRMPVVYPGQAPNDFKPGSALVVEGRYASTGIFQATSLTTRGSPLCKACHAS